jgi:enamine deaminase RidA (YjgF/YER057c/UK114 family)
MTSRPPPEALNPQKGNIMSIIRHEIRKISDENRGQPIISQAVVHGDVAYFAGITPNPIVGDIKTQTAQVLRRVDELLNLAGTDKSQLLSAQVWIAVRRSQYCLERVGRSGKPSGAGLPHDRLLATWDAR